ncbi:ABC transporter permease subunit [Gordonia sp. PDNC005]|uniref:ABC transporter permease subunit n=1 Tax=unclassified Gordonia (in: high G+C Gram-positive bacteria) TaxID=2657482 RepID=UPI0019648FB3|nr:ABC transporter permease subunit [Gordonia sp. PDNC005]QRY64330.1 ABC transporter permease subunit [Gordonia sp. PDNC005]
MTSRVRAIVPLLVVLVAALGLLTACSSSSDSGNSGVIRFGTEGTYSPFSFHDPATGELTGYDVDVAKAVAEKMGKRAEFVEAPWDSLFAALGADRFDVVANQVTITPERESKYSMSIPYAVGEGVIVTRADDTSITSLDDLKGRTSAQSATSNWTGVATKAGARVETVEGFAQAITLLRQGRVDATVNDSLSVYAYLAETGDTTVKIAAKVGERSESAFAAPRGSPLTTDINKAIEALQADGTLSEISKRYLKTDASGAVQKAAEPQSTWDLVRTNLWPMAKATVTTTIPLAAISFVIGLVIALVVALARLSERPGVAWLARVYISIIRGTPLLVQLFIIFYALPEIGIKVEPFPAAIVAFSLNVGGYAAEIIRAAIISVPSGQTEAAQTIGMDYATTMRRIILPQAARIAVPGLSNTLISLVKDTSLASVILVTELFRTAQIAAAPTFEFLPLYVTAAVYYWVVCLVLSMLQGRLELRLGRFIAS